MYRRMGSGLFGVFSDARSWRDLIYDPKARGVAFQAALLIILFLFAWEVVGNTIENLKRLGIASGFGFLDRTAGFDISQTLIAYSSKMSYGRAFWVGLTNTLLVSALGIVLASVLGFLLGLSRLSSNWLVSRIALVYVEIVRNVPLLLQLFFWYVAVLRALPAPQDALSLGGGNFLDKRGLHLTRLVFEEGSGAVLMSALLGVAAALFLARRYRLARVAGWARFSIPIAIVLLAIGLPLLCFFLAGMPFSFDYPRLGRFNFEGGLGVEPEFLALLLGLSFYAASFIAEIVRSGIEAVARGQTEAGAALGLSRWQVQRFIVLPQAMRVIIPPLTNQFLNLTKNSSLAVAIGYPDLVSVFGGTVLNQTGQAVEVIVITMGVYLTLSLITSLIMGWFNRRMALVEG
jgi:general L-amino acid transport system permease protein